MCFYSISILFFSTCSLLYGSIDSVDFSVSVNTLNEVLALRSLNDLDNRNSVTVQQDTLSRDTVIETFPTQEELEAVVTVQMRKRETAQLKETLSEKEIRARANQSLSEIVSEIPGVDILSSGGAISKPMIHGLYGNRIMILNNGVVQGGQQWGSDHAPEIDPFVGDKIEVVKGVGSLAHQGSSLGGVISIAPSKISDNKKVKGVANYIFQTNGMGNTANAKMEQNTSIGKYRVTLTGKYFGDRSTPNYYLTNTGNRETDIALQYETSFSHKEDALHPSLEVYYSHYYSEIGVLKGAHVSSIKSLERAIESDIPFFTNEHFSYKINPPRQEVTHQLLKIKNSYLFGDKELSLIYALQMDNRDEFDVRRGNRSNTPVLSLDQKIHSGDIQYKQENPKGYLLKTGFQITYTDNTNKPETGILPLIPDYVQLQLGSYVMLSRQHNRWMWEIGGRYDYLWQYALPFSSSIPRVVEKHEKPFHTYTFAAGATKLISSTIDATLNIGYSLRPPAINEIYSLGLHQGVGGIEEGNLNLKPEHATKILFELGWDITRKLSLQTTSYFQFIDGFINLEPQAELRQTIRGAFPVFAYEQHDARIIGIDGYLSYNPTKNWSVLLNGSYIRGDNVGEDVPLVNMPSNNIGANSSYKWNGKKEKKSITLSIGGEYVFRQSRLYDWQDFLEPPAGYFLLESSLVAPFKLKRGVLSISLTAKNILNKAYRNYTNRLRYFADDLGRDFSLGVSYVF